LKAPLANLWSPTHGIAIVGGFAAVASAVTVGARPAGADRPGSDAYLAFVAGGLAVALSAAGSLRVGLVAAALAAASGGSAVASVARPSLRSGAEAAVPVLLLLVGIGAVFAELPWWSALGFAAAPLGVAIARADRQRIPWRSALAGLAVGAIGAGAVLYAIPPVEM
jgi:hypothetical protein